ncbi:penicillin-binding protein 2 [Paenibacillus sp. YYML68]|uniref:peptidoglycan D,D-transpeptidase FtsI family protein n=1 Tax=Paenibacillus sp. YYML68 TaxID=2909250 RepID=UPI0024912B02|nr:penicillin-binding transpeptidase domain-containing protein [Paenibacillus sp. YYML68]
MNDTTEQPKHRIFIILMLIIIALLVWNIRLFWIQIAAAGSFTSRRIDLVGNSVLQREQGIVLDSGRGDFYDSSGRPLTGRTYPALAVFPINTGMSQAERWTRLQAVASLLHTSAQQLDAYQQSLNHPELWGQGQLGRRRAMELTPEQVEGLSALRLPDWQVTMYKQRYAESQVAAHMIGYIGQNPERITKQFTDQFHRGELQLTSRIGNAGLEKMFEPWLRGIGPTSVSLFTDARRIPLPGMDIRTFDPANPYYPLKVITTLELDVQERIEQKLEQLAVQDGAVVVLRLDNADVTAVASRPAFHPEHVHLELADWGNRALQAQTPGSIFKTVTAAAALEEHVVRLDETFHCDGELGRYGFSCWKKGGHGTITLQEAFAHSCNIVFAKVAERIGGVQLEQYAGRMGLTEPVGWTGQPSGRRETLKQWDGEQAGHVYAFGTDKNDAGALVQTSIGQRDVQLTPLQAANLLVTLYHGGEVLSPRIVKEIRFRNDRLYERFDEQEAKLEHDDVIGEKTSRTLLQWMGDVVAYGTGQPLQKSKWPVAGKSGTAEVRSTSGGPAENHWFIGYGPTDKPQYAVAVLIRGVPQGTPNKSLQLFREVMDVLASRTP